MNYNILRRLIQEKKIQRKEIATILGMTPSGYDHMMVKETMSVKSLQKLCHHFSVPISYFFDDQLITASEVLPNYGKVHGRSNDETINLLLSQNNLVIKQVSELIAIQKMNADTINKLSSKKNAIG